MAVLMAHVLPRDWLGQVGLQDNRDGRDGSAVAVDPRSHSQSALSPRTTTQQSITGDTLCLGRGRGLCHNRCHLV